MTRSTSAEIDARVTGLTVPKQFLDLVAAEGKRNALRTINPDGTWTSFTFNDVLQRTAQTAAGLLADGVTPGERVLLMMRNRPDFHWLDLGAQFVRATPVSIYNSSSAEEIQYLAEHAEAEIAIVEDNGFLQRLLQIRGDLPMLGKIYVIEPPEGELPDGVHLVSELLSHGEADLEALAAATSPEDLATLIYTSGTTGPPKGVMLSQYNVVYTVELLAECFEAAKADVVGWRVVSYLPMAHIAERSTTHYGAMIFGYEVSCCPDLAQLSAYLKDTHPQIMFGVPRVYEKMYAGVNAALSADPERAAQFDEGVAAAIEIKRAERDGTITDEQRATLEFLDSVAFAGVRGLLGLDELQICITGAAPIPIQILEWFGAIGVPLSEIYGMSESTGPITWSPRRNRPGCVGQAIPGMEVALADDGEVIARGGNVFVGYLKQPEKTAETIIDGWLHTGDIGEIDADGYLRIVDRKKELIITSGGKNISPSNLEAALKMIPLVGQACAIGDQRKFITALLVLDPEAAPVWAAQNGKEGMSLAELADDADVAAAIQEGVDEINQQFASVEQIKKFVLLGEEWLPDTDVLTPTSKLKRRGILVRYADHIESMYV
ncbi:MAG TPA: AMP-binding protein [Ilumatobacter sp.]|nr:AMP-binding protein [Ilumatobacter sp.]